MGRIAALLFVAGGLAAAPAYALMSDPAPPAAIYLLPAMAVVSGVGCFFLPWERFGAWVLHLIPTAATLEVALSVWAVGPHAQVLAWYYVFVAVYAALSFQRRAPIVTHVSLMAVALAAPAVYEPDQVHDALVHAIVGIPTLVVAAAVVTILRERFEAGEQALRELAGRDPLTGVGNYRTLYEHLDRELARHARSGRELGLVVIDLDNFKDVNEEHGHLEGDRLLREVGRALSATVREVDTLARQGGDEFSVVVPEAGRDEAEALRERLRAALATVEAGGWPLTAGIGYAIFPRDGQSADELMAHADGALLGGKRARRLSGT